MMADFSLSTWKGENQITESEMKASDIVLLQEVLGIPEYLKDSCHRQAGNYFPHKNFWKDGVFFLSNVNEQKYKPICFNYKINLFKSLNEIGEKERMIFFQNVEGCLGLVSSQTQTSSTVTCLTPVQPSPAVWRTKYSGETWKQLSKLILVNSP